MGIPTAALDPNSQAVSDAYQTSSSWVNEQLSCIGTNQFMGGPSLYAIAVYNLGGDLIINYAQDAANNPYIYPGSNPPTPYFQWLRQKFKINDFLTGVVTSSSDEGTSQSLIVQEAMKTITLADLQLLKTPYGRRYLAIAQQYGPSVWGLS